MKKKRQIERSALFLAVCHSSADFFCFGIRFYSISEKSA